MTEMNISEKRSVFHYVRLPIWLKLLYLRHEAWVLKIAIRLPFLAVFPVMTLWVWFILPMIPIFILIFFIIEREPTILGMFFVMYTGIVGLFIMFTWFGRWYFVLPWWPFGSTKKTKIFENEVLDRIAQLTKLKAARKNP